MSESTEAENVTIIIIIIYILNIYIPEESPGGML